MALGQDKPYNSPREGLLFEHKRTNGKQNNHTDPKAHQTSKAQEVGYYYLKRRKSHGGSREEFIGRWS